MFKYSTLSVALHMQVTCNLFSKTVGAWESMSFSASYLKAKNIQHILYPRGQSLTESLSKGTVLQKVKLKFWCSQTAVLMAITQQWSAHLVNMLENILSISYWTAYHTLSWKFATKGKGKNTSLQLREISYRPNIHSKIGNKVSWASLDK